MLPTGSASQVCLLQGDLYAIPAFMLACMYHNLPWYLFVSTCCLSLLMLLPGSVPEMLLHNTVKIVCIGPIGLFHVDGPYVCLCGLDSRG